MTEKNHHYIIACGYLLLMGLASASAFTHLVQSGLWPSEIVARAADLASEVFTVPFVFIIIGFAIADDRRRQRGEPLYYVIRLQHLLISFAFLGLTHLIDHFVVYLPQLGYLQLILDVVVLYRCLRGFIHLQRDQSPNLTQ